MRSRTPGASGSGPCAAGRRLICSFARWPAPPLTATTASDLIGRSFQATSQAIDRLVEAGIVTQVTVGRRNRAFEGPELIEAFTALERQLASPEGDTVTSEPTRRVPRRHG